MVSPPEPAIVRALLDEYGRSYAHEAGIRIERGTPAVLFQLLVLALLLSAPIPASKASEAAKALVDAKLTTPRKMLEASWQARVDVITWHGYKRYDEKTSTMLGQTAQLLLDEYAGDLRKLREAANYEVAREHALLQAFKGIGPVGADIFLREVQGVWEEVYPFADARVRAAAERLGLPADARALSKLVPRAEFPRLASALIRTSLAHEHGAGSLWAPNSQSNRDRADDVRVDLSRTRR
jgi:endonuclease III